MAKNTHKKNNTKILESFEDPKYQDKSEPEDKHQGRAKTASSLLKCSVVC
jgi:hypothetical protein